LASRDHAPTPSRSGHCANSSSASGTTSHAASAEAASSAAPTLAAMPADAVNRPSFVESHSMRHTDHCGRPGRVAGRRPERPPAAPLWPGLALAMAGSIAFSGKAIIVKLAYRYGVDAVTLIMYRMLFALPLFALLAWWAGRGKPALTAARLARRLGARAFPATTSRASSTSPACSTSRPASSG
jgi:hypothetical protein